MKISKDKSSACNNTNKLGIIKKTGEICLIIRKTEFNTSPSVTYYTLLTNSGIYNYYETSLSILWIYTDEFIIKQGVSWKNHQTKS